MKVKLTDVCSPKQWKTIPVDKLLSEGYPVYGANGIIGYYNEYNHEESVVTVTCRGATCGNVNLTSPKSYVTGNAMCLDNVDEKIDIHYLYYCMKSFNFSKIISGSAQPQITRQGLNKVTIEVYPLEKQKQIVSILDTVSGIIEKRKKQLEDLDELVKARFVEMFGDPVENPMGWDVVKVSDVIIGKASNGFFAKRDDYTEEGNVSVLGVSNIVNRMYSNLSSLPKANASKKDIEKYSVKYGDILFCRSSLVAEGIGKASIIPEKIDNDILFECHVIKISLNMSCCIPEFIQVLTTTSFFRNQVISQSKTSTMTTIGQEGILKCSIILPPIIEQKRFLLFVKKTEEIKEKVQKSLDEMQVLFDKLMQDYF